MMDAKARFFELDSRWAGWWARLVEPTAARFVALLLVALVLMTALSRVDGSLRTDRAPDGIRSLRFAGSALEVERIFYSWSLAEESGARELRPRLGLAIDVLLAWARALTLSMACIWSGRRLGRRRWKVRHLAGIAVRAQPLAAVLNLFANLLLLFYGSLRGDVAAQLAVFFATLEAALVWLGLLVVALGAVAAFSLFLGGGER